MQGDMRCGFDPWVEKIPRWRKWQPTPVFLPGKSRGQRSLEGPGGLQSIGSQRIGCNWRDLAHMQFSASLYIKVKSLFSSVSIKTVLLISWRRMRVFDWVCLETEMRWWVTKYLCLTSPFYCQYLSSEFSHLDTSVSLFRFLANLISSSFQETHPSFVHVASCWTGLSNSKVKLFSVPCLGRFVSKAIKYHSMMSRFRKHFLLT